MHEVPKVPQLPIWDLIGWLSELVKQREAIVLSIRELETIIPK